MYVSVDAVPKTACALPDLTITDPRRKNKAFITQFGRGYLWAYAQSGSVDFFRGRNRYAELEAYANGDNVVKSALKKDETGQTDPENAKIDFRPLPLLKKPLMSVEGLLKEHSYEATVTAVDDAARDERAMYEGIMRGWMAEQQFLANQAGNTPPGGPGAQIPLDEQDLALHMDTEYKLPEAMAMEQKIAFGMYLADYARQDQLCTRDETVLGASVLYMARRGPRRLPVHIKSGDALIMPAKTENFPNLQAGAHIERLSMGQVLAEIDDDPHTTLGVDELNQLKKLAESRQRSGSDGYASMGGGLWMDSAVGTDPELAGQIDVIRFAFVSTDMQVQKELIDQLGNRQLFDMKPDYKGPSETAPQKNSTVKIHRRAVQNWYEGTLILGSDISYGCQLAYAQLRDEDDPFTCLPLYIVNAPGMVGGKIKSMVENCKVMVDIASRAVVKMQHNEAKWWDLTIKLNRDVLQEAAVNGGPGGKNLTSKEVMSELVREGIITGNEVDASGEQMGKVMEWIETPLGNAVTRHWITIQNAKAEIADITGVNGAISGDDPASRQGEGVTNLAIQGSQNALNHLFVAKHSRFERAARAIAASIKTSEAKAPFTGSLVSDGQGGPKRNVYVKPAPKLIQRSFTFKIEQKPTQQQWDRFYDMMNNALVEKEITSSDVAYLMTIDNLKQARYLLASRSKRNIQQQQQQKAADIKSQGEATAQAAQAKGDEDRKTAKDKTENRIKEINATGMWAYKNTLATLNAQQQVAAQSQEGKFAQLAAQHDHEANLAADEINADLARHSATLDSQEQESDVQRQHEMELAAQQPAPVAA